MAGRKIIILTEAQENEITERLLARQTIVEVAKAMGLSRSYIGRYKLKLKQQGKDVVNRVTVSEAEKEQIANLIEEGIPLSAIVKKTGRSLYTVKRIKKEIDEWYTGFFESFTEEDKRNFCKDWDATTKKILQLCKKPERRYNDWLKI